MRHICGGHGRDPPQHSGVESAGNIVDDDPAPVREWLPAMGEALGAKPPRHVPVWLARMIAGDVAVMLGTEVRGASNAKAKRELGWNLRHPSWREGFVEAYGKQGAAIRQPRRVAVGS